jgi:glycosyltransferase involved in cell wall biosynthesis
MVDFNFAQKPDIFIANSKNVAKRILKFYRRESVIVYPPIVMPVPPYNSPPNLGGDKREGMSERGSYFLIISRIVGSKNIELAVAAANKYGFKLKVAGRPIGKSGKEIVGKISGPNAEYLGEVSEEERIKLIKQAKAFLNLEKDADFGMTAVEPQVYGTPVIAYRSGGYLEAVEENKTGIFFNELSPEGLWEGIQRFNKIKWDSKLISIRSKRFAKEVFVEKIKNITK